MEIPVKVSMQNLRFIHIPKCGGSSIWEIYKLKPQHKARHWDAQPVPNKINFAVIRNPYSRIQSIFAHGKDLYNQLTNLKYFDTLDDLAIAYFDSLHPNHLIAIAMFNWSKSKLLTEEPSTKHRCVDTSNNLIHFAPQSIFIIQDKGFNADTPLILLRLEYLAQDLQYYIDRGKLPPLPPGANTNLVTNKSSSKNKARAQMTPIIVKLVRTVYKRDLELYEKVYGHPATIS